MDDSDALAVANEVAAPHGLRAEFLGDVKSVGVGGDYRTYTRVIVLFGPWPGHETLAAVATEISNRTGLNRITYDITRLAPVSGVA